MTDHSSKRLNCQVLLLRIEHFRVQLNVSVRLVSTSLKNIALALFRLVLITRRFDDVTLVSLEIALLHSLNVVLLELVFVRTTSLT